MKHLVKKTKTDESVDKYKELIFKSEYKSSSILHIVPKSNLIKSFKYSFDFEFCEELNITTYLGFIKRELVTYWPFVLNDCDEVGVNKLSPEFISNNLVEYLIYSKVKELRESEGYFDDVISSNRSIAINIKINIEKSIYSLENLEFIGDKLFNSKKNKDNINRFSYTQMDEVISYYKSKLLSNSIIDNAMSVYLYNNYLLKNCEYIEKLKTRFAVLIVDSVELSSNAEVDFINIVSENTKDTYIYFDEVRNFNVFDNIDIGYLQEKILKDFGCSYNIDYNDKLKDICLMDVDIKLDDSSNLYSEMLDNIVNKIDELLVNGVSKKEIAVITPSNNSILQIRLSDLLSKINVHLLNTRIDKKINDYPYANALLVSCCIFFNCMDLVSEDEYINFVKVLLSTNAIVAYDIYKNRDKILCGEIDMIENYLRFKEIITYIDEVKKDNILIHEFLIKFYINRMLNLEFGKENVKICKEIIYESKLFVEKITALGICKNKSPENIFVQAFKMTVQEYYSLSDINEVINKDEILITTPSNFISLKINRPVQIWLDLGSNMWSMKIEKELSNLVVLRKSYIENKIFTSEIEDFYKNYYLNNTIYNLMKHAKKIFAYKSEYTINGYIQEGLLYGLMLKILNGKEESIE